MYVFPWNKTSYMYGLLVGPYVCNATLFRVRLVQKLVQDWVWTHFLVNYGREGSPTNNYGLLYQVILFRFFQRVQRHWTLCFTRCCCIDYSVLVYRSDIQLQDVKEYFWYELHTLTSIRWFSIGCQTCIPIGAYLINT